MKYGCHNREPYKEPHRMSPVCEYTKTDLGQADARCVGCKWKEQKMQQVKQEQGEPVASDAYDKIDRFLRNNLGDVDYAEYSAALDSVYTTPQQRKPLTDEMIVAGGKALAKLHADTCGLDFDDVWKYYAEDHKADAKAAIEAAHGIKE